MPPVDLDQLVKGLELSEDMESVAEEVGIRQMY
jgi:hypothetical protein